MAPQPKIPKFEHIILIVMENRSYDEIIGSKNASFVNRLLKEGALAGNYYAITHPSLPNYIALLSGNTFGMAKNCVHCFLNKTNLIDQLEKAHISWRAYFESLPHPCFLGSSSPSYTKKYNAFVYFSNIFKNKARCKNIVPYKNISADLESTSSPDFIWISPNLCSDTHYCQVKTGDDWLAKEVPKILNSKQFKNTSSLLIITWDEAERKGGNHIATLFLGKNVRSNFIATAFYNHFSLLRTIEDSWGLHPLTSFVQNARPMSEMFQH